MFAKEYFSYVRVSTQKQGEQGTSLVEQQAAIERFAQNSNFKIIQRFEERETAAKQGRPVFLEMLKKLRMGKAEGVIIHKIDRSARNLKDWADLGSLIDKGIEVHFASESLDLNSRGGRLSADIQAVVASDYIRNLREESKKGIYGRLKQGFYPFPAPVGYLDNGKAKPKTIDPIAGPLVKEGFELYATGRYGLISLSDLLYARGLRSKRGNKIGRNALSSILQSPFYMGMIRIKKTGELFPGVHEPLVNRRLLDQVQVVLKGKNHKKQHVHFFSYRRMITCEKCANILVPERQKGNVYYRCHTRDCTRSCLKEEEIYHAIGIELKRIKFSDREFELFSALAKKECDDLKNEMEETRRHLELQYATSEERLSRLTDGYIDGILDKKDYMSKKNELVSEQHELARRRAESEQSSDHIPNEIVEFLELANSAYLSFVSANPEQRRDLVDSVFSNFTANGKSVSFKLKIPFEMAANRPRVPPGAPIRATSRTITPLIRNLVKYFLDIPKPLSADPVV